MSDWVAQEAWREAHRDQIDKVLTQMWILWLGCLGEPVALTVIVYGFDAQLREAFANESDEILRSDSGFGLENVNKRIQLYYGKEYGLRIESQYQEGTTVTVAIPLREDMNAEEPEEKS